MRRAFSRFVKAISDVSAIVAGMCAGLALAAIVVAVKVMGANGIVN